MLERIGTLPEDLGKPEKLHTGYFSEANVALCAAAQIDPMIAQGRQWQPLSERFAKVPSAGEPDADGLPVMARRRLRQQQ